MATVEYDFEAPVWWDPKVRRSIWNHSTFRLGMLLVRGDHVVVATVRGVLCSARLAALRVEWPGMFELPMCDLVTGDERHRLFFVAPHPRAATFHGRVPTAITAVLDASPEIDDGDHAHLASTRTPKARWPSQLTEPMGRKRMEAFRGAVERTGAVSDPS